MISQSTLLKSLKLSALLLLTGVLFAVRITTTTTAQADDPTKWTLQQWQSWRDEKIADILTPTPAPGGSENVLNRERVIDKCAEANELLRPILEKDPEFFKKDAELARNMNNFIAFVQAQSLMHPNDTSKNQLGFTITDQEYWSYAKSNLVFPDLLQSQQFLEFMSQPATYAQAAAAIDAQNASLPAERKWIYLPFEAQFIRSIRDEGHGRTYGRMLVLIPNEPTGDGGTLDRWVLFSLATPDQPVPGDIRPVSMIAMRNPPPSADGKPPRQKAFFMDFIRERDPATKQIKLIPTVLSPGHISKNCFDCHKSAVLSIRPAAEFEFVNGEMRKKAVSDGEVAGRANRFIRLYRSKYGLPDWGHLDTGAYGPSLGPDGRLRTDEFIAKASGDLNLPAGSYDRIRIAMDCASCHKGFAPLNYMQAVINNRDASSFRRREGLLRTYIEEGWMPPGFNLNEVERKALWRCLITEYFDMETKSGVLVDWLKGLDPDRNSPEELLQFNRELTDGRALAASNKLLAFDGGGGAKLRPSSAELMRLAVSQLRAGEGFLRRRRYREAERSLWTSYENLRAHGVRGQLGLSREKAVTDALRRLYAAWRAPESAEGAKRLKALEQGSGHGD